MSKITWDSMENRLYERGVDHAVLYALSGDEYISGVPWNGVTGIDPGKSSGESKTLYSGGVPALVAINTEGTEGSITALGYPSIPIKPNVKRHHYEHFGVNEVAEGVSVKTADRTPCGLCYRTMSADAIGDSDESYVLHLLYGVIFKDVAHRYATINGSTTNPVEYTFNYVVLGQISDEFGLWYDEVKLDSRVCGPQVLEDIENILYGDEENDPRLPYLDEIADYFTAYQIIPDGYEYYPYELRFPRPDIYPQEEEEEE